MDHEASRTMEVAALGRPFSLGMLYDCRQDSLIPGITLWDREDLGKDAGVRPQPATEFEIVASESIEDKSSALNVETSLKASFLGGLVGAEGSAKYLNDQKKSKHQARVTLQYKTTTKFQELSMNHLGIGNMKHSYVFEKGIATHVVTGILYGAQAFFIFDREVSEKESHQDVQGNLKVMINKIPNLAIAGEGSLKMEEKDKANVDKFSCKFHGDFSLEKNPVTFQDAVEVYQSLPKLLGANGNNAVPLKVCLLPLVSLNSAAAKLVREISVRLVQEAQSVLEDFNELEMRCNDALRETAAQQFPEISKKIKDFKGMCSEFRMDFQHKLAKKLPSIRGGGEEEAVLAEILKRRHSSPFNSKDLYQWMDCKERELCTLKSFTNMMKNTKIVSSQNDVYRESLSAEHVVCFVFTSLGGSEPYLSALSHHLQDPGNTQTPNTYDIEKEQWYLSNKAANDMRHKTKLFRDFAEANKEKQKVKFLTLGLTNKTFKGSSIYLYEDGLSLSENFEPPSKPEAVTVSDVNHSSVTLKVSPPRFGADSVASYSVEFRVRGDEAWQRETASKPGEVTVSGLRLDTEYEFRCRAETSAGVGPHSDISGSVRTLPCSPPGRPRLKPNSSEISVSWEEPAELGPVPVLSYVVEFAKTGNGLKEEDLAWKKVTSGSTKSVISGLESETEYVVRVRCDCGVSGSSKESVSASVSTTKREFVETFKHIGKKMNSEAPSCYKLPLEDVDIDGCRIFNFGKESMRQNRTIMLLGATEAGKSTLINGMINYIVGVEWKDDFRYKLVDEGQSKSQAESQTSEVTVYKLNHQEGFHIPFSLTIIDTPGFGDTRGINRDRMIVEQLRSLFSAKDGVTGIDAVCFVAQASLARFTPTQKYVFDSVLSIFGKDIAENIRVLVTFCDGQRPPVLEVINAAGVPCSKTKDGLPEHFKFNNSSLFADNKPEGGDDDDGNIDQMFWNMGTKSLRTFFTALNRIETKSLTLTKEVLGERKQLENSIENLQMQVKVGLAKLKKIEETSGKLRGHKAMSKEMSRNRKPPTFKDYTNFTEYQTMIAREEKYAQMIKKQRRYEELIDRLKAEYDEAQAKVVKLVEESGRCLNRLKEIALKPNLLSTPEYIDMLIEGEKQRVQALMAMRERAEYMAKVEKGEKLLQTLEDIEKTTRN